MDGITNNNEVTINANVINNGYIDNLPSNSCVEVPCLINSNGCNPQKFGKLPAKAFPGRAAILLKLLGLNESQISGIYEKRNSMKIGHYAPATRIKIMSDSHLKKITIKVPIINLAWHIDREIKTYCSYKNIV